MKKALKVLLLSIPIAILFYSGKMLVPAVDAKNLLIRGIVAIVAVLIAVLYVVRSDFRPESSQKLKLFWKNPLGKSLTISYGVLIVSTIFAYSPFTAFFGTASRGEGFVGLSFFYFLTLFLFVVFEKKDWFRFWQLTAVGGIIVFITEFTDFLGGAYRPGSLMDNPIFLAGYFLIVIFAGLLVWKSGKEEKNNLSLWLGGIATMCSIIGMFITESRGAMLGMIIGVFVALLYFVFAESGNTKKNIFFRKITIAIISCMIIFGGIFVATRHSSFWIHVPGLNRVAQFSLSDPTTQSRIENARLTLRAVRPTGSNIKNTLVGWGWDNYVFAWQSNYDPKIYLYDRGIFDRAHNKLLDVLVMNGILGLVAYLAIWFFLVRSALFLGKQSVFMSAVTLFFLTAFFIQNLTVFDTVISYVPFFAVIGYMLFATQRKYE